MLRIKFDKKKIFNFRILLLAGVVVLILMTVGLIREVINRYQINNQINDLSDEISQLEKENSQLGSLISNFESNGELEKEARLKLGLMKPGERVVLILREQATGTVSSSTGQETNLIGEKLVANNDEDRPNPIKWWKYFFH